MFRHLTTLSFALRPSPTSMHVTIEKLQSRQWQSDPMLTGVDHLSLAKINLTMTPADESLSKSPVENHPRVEQAIRINLKPRGASAGNKEPESESLWLWLVTHLFRVIAAMTRNKELSRAGMENNAARKPERRVMAFLKSARPWRSSERIVETPAQVDLWRAFEQYCVQYWKIIGNVSSILCTILLLILLNITLKIK